MNYQIFFTLILLTISRQLTAGEVDIASLGSLELEFAQAQPANLYPGQPLAAQVAYRKGDAFILISPGRVQQIEYLVEAGTLLQKGQAFAILRGPEMHHFQIEYESSKSMADAARRRFDSNKALYQRKAIREDQWMEVSEKYYAAQLEYEHLRHFYELVESDVEDPDSLTLVAPFTGLLDYAVMDRAVEAGEGIAEFIPPSAIRIEVQIPNNLRRDVAYLQARHCRLAIERIAAVTRGFFVTAWTETLQSECQLIPGQALLVTPLLRATAFRVPKSAVFQWDKGSHVLVLNDQQLSTTPVTLLGADEDDYILRSEAPLTGRKVLISSVSAVQGVLLGLGGE